MLQYLQQYWPISALLGGDHVLKESYRMVSKLDIPDYTKHFVLGIREPESGALIYILCAHGLSERSARDIQHLIRAVRPDVVLADSDWNWYVQYCEDDYGDSPDEPIPTSTFRVLRECLKDRLSIQKYRDVARNLVLQEIFWVGYGEDIIVAKKTAEEVGCPFLMVPSKYFYKDPLKLPQRVNSSLDTESYRPPPYASWLYPVLVKLTNFFSMDRTLVCARKMLDDVGTGANVDPEDLFQSYNFQIGIERCRLWLHRDGIKPYGTGTEKVVKYSELSDTEVFNCLVAQGIKEQAKKYNKIVAIVHGHNFSNLRRFWNTPTLPENESAVEGFFVRYEDSGVRAPTAKKQKKTPTGPAVAGVTAALTGSVLFKDELTTPVYRFMKREWRPGGGLHPGIFMLLVLDGFFMAMSFCIQQVLLLWAVVFKACSRLRSKSETTQQPMLIKSKML